MKWPVLCIPSNGSRAEVVKEKEVLTTSTMLGVTSGWYTNLRVVDADGKVYTIIRATFKRSRNPLLFLWRSLLGGRITVILESSCIPSQIALAELKDLIVADVLAHRSLYESGRPVRELVSCIHECTTHREIIDCLSWGEKRG
jgi:hypothetical protein